MRDIVIIALRRKSKREVSLTRSTTRTVSLGLIPGGLTKCRPPLASYADSWLGHRLKATGLFGGMFMFKVFGRPAVRLVFHRSRREASLTAGGEALWGSFLVGYVFWACPGRRPGVTRGQPPGHRPRSAASAFSSSARAIGGSTFDECAASLNDLAKIQNSGGGRALLVFGGGGASSGHMSPDLPTSNGKQVRPMGTAPARRWCGCRRINGGASCRHWCSNIVTVSTGFAPSN